LSLLHLGVLGLKGHRLKRSVGAGCSGEVNVSGRCRERAGCDALAVVMTAIPTTTRNDADRHPPADDDPDQRPGDDPPAGLLADQTTSPRRNPEPHVVRVVQGKTAVGPYMYCCCENCAVICLYDAALWSISFM